jgi:hypothetical protein
MRKTGLFIPYWLADLFSDGLKQAGPKTCFEKMREAGVEPANPYGNGS